ncbi:DUF1570 domain-containing protein [Limibacter armeniacum]|uniref:DUF1570 domain-containing protein n=1 Tax=Limibacter armeniacum TaxID=466084 RepID=UPI002FE65E2B
MFVGFSELKRPHNNLYISDDVDSSMENSLLEKIYSAEQNIALFFGDKSSSPIILAGNNQEFIHYFGAQRNVPGVCHNALNNTYIVLGPNGLNIDVISHEMTHAELIHRVGWFNREYEIPTWFDEGLAMMLDHRYDTIGDIMWERLTLNGEFAPRLHQMENMKGFLEVSEISPYISYMTSKREVQRWWDIVGLQGFNEFTGLIRAGTPFKKAYSSIENKYSKSNRLAPN